MTDEQQHIRQLLDARYAHTAVYADDTPSVYSVPFFSPRPSDSDVHSLHSFRSPPSSPPPLEPRSRLNDYANLEPRSRLNDLANSMLDFDDDSQTESHSDSEEDAAETVDADHDTRMSFLGPRMRMIEKAPWELSDTLEEEEEIDPDRPRGRDGFKKGMGFRSSSRGTTASSRPSGESSRSHQAKPKRSFETTSSTSSPQSRGSPFNTLSTGNGRSGLRLNFPVTRSESPGYANPPSPRAPPSPRSIISYHSNTPSPFPSNNKSPLTRRDSYSEEMHPYANPDLVVSYADDQDSSLTPAPNRTIFRVPSIARSEASTVTESTSLSRSVTGSTLTADTSSTSMSPSHSPRMRASMFHGKEISAPIPIPSTVNISSPLMAPALPPGQNFALISLEEARAQRTRNTQNFSIATTSTTPFPEAPPDGPNHSPTNSVASRSRARSISAGARAKVALQNIVAMPAKPERRDSEPLPAKSLKHKKSGFMRLFNGGRGNGDERDSPPPVPQLSDEYVALNAQQSNGIRSAKSSIHRVPPPEISTSMLFDSGRSDDRLSPRPSPPALSINTGSQGRLRAASTVDDFQTRTVPSDLSDRDWHQADLPQSAPPNVTEFPALKLRPVSTMFSAHFADHLVLPPDSDSQPSLDDADTSSSTSPTSIAPITPAILGRGNSAEKDTRIQMTTISEDQTSLVQSLQQQLASSKKAWQRHIQELESQVRDLKGEVERLRAVDGDYCDTCGRGRQTSGVVNRPRSRNGAASRFGSAV
ncbi:hypothetical protein MIND_00471000 [Mycena indigotica]|uniref:Uncharacterized protein n=1 Tax=Mycena indigotica TaxID=2126181 RepID=A0A8H6SVQ8_9AGAR|nr:uncharacterized protein MIND_00471000 [Mycena indigotica]KAF7306793.1 hypothetical protein MIND_00471000 [Mycena indigotica]